MTDDLIARLRAHEWLLNEATDECLLDAAADALEAKDRRIASLQNDMKFLDGKNDELRELLETDRNTIDELRARISALEAALKPFADAEKYYKKDHHDCGLWDRIITVGDLRAARAAMEGK